MMQFFSRHVHVNHMYVLLLAFGAYAFYWAISSWFFLYRPAIGGFKSSRHGSLRYFSRPADEPSKLKGITLVLLHGLGCNARDTWVGLAEQLNTHLGQHSIVAPDLLGHGASKVPYTYAPYQMRNQASLVLELLMAQPFPRRYALVGHSMGGAVAAHLADLISKSTQTELVGVVYEEGNLDIGDAFVSNRLVTSRSWRAAAAVLAQLSRAVPGYFLNDRFHYTAVVASSVDLVKCSKSGQMLPMLLATNRPLLFMFGELNRGRYTSEQLLRDRGLEANIVYVPGVGHGVHMTQADFVFGRLQAFLSKACTFD